MIDKMQQQNVAEVIGKTAKKVIETLSRGLNNWIWKKYVEGPSSNDSAEDYCTGSSAAGGGGGICSGGAGGTNYEESTLSYTYRHLSSLFVAEVSIANTFLIIMAVFLWTVNRQSHFYETRGSTVLYKEEQQEGTKDDRKKVSSMPGDGSEDDGTESSSQESRTALRKSYKFLSDCDIEDEEGDEFCGDDDDDDDDDDKNNNNNNNNNNSSDMEDKTYDDKKDGANTERSLADLVSSMKLFSYMNEEAFEVCVDHGEYVDVPLGESLFERNKYDGSLYAVLSGKIRCCFHDYLLPEDEPLDEEEKKLSEANLLVSPRVLAFSSEPGEIVTPLLAILTAMVNHQHKDDGNFIKISDHQQVSAVATAPGTRLVRFPPETFAAVLRRFPAEAHRLAQTIITRAERISIHALDRTLGLRSELLLDPNGKNSSILWWFFRTTEWKRLSSNISSGNKVSTNDSAIVAAIRLGVPLSYSGEKGGSDDSEGLKLLREHVKIVFLSEGEDLFRRGSRIDSIYVLLQGGIDVGVSLTDTDFHRLYIAQPGALLGTLAGFTGENSLFSMRCSRAENEKPCWLLKIPKFLFFEFMVRYPTVLTRCLDELLRQLSPLVHTLNWNSEWMHVRAAEDIAKRGDRCDSMFIVLNGRLRAGYHRRGLSFESDDVEEYGRGKRIGDVGGLTRSHWFRDVYAIRNSELARVPMRTLLSIIQKYPQAGLNYARVIASRLQSEYGERRGMTRTAQSSQLPTILPSYGLSCATIAVVPFSSDINISKFCSSLVSALGKIAPSKLITKGFVGKELGEKVFRQRDAMHDLKMTRLLGDMEENSRLVVYQADPNYTWWTKLCIQQADCILLAVEADKAPEKNRIEQGLAWAYESMNVRIDLVVIAKPQLQEEQNECDAYDENDNVSISDRLNNWSEERQWVAGHHLVRMPFQVHGLDFSRMCRRVTGLAVGLVLGGGGARGLAHVGVIRALVEAGVVVDLVGGTSQGAIVGALYAKNPENIEELMNSCQELARRMSLLTEKLLDMTLPMTSIFSGKRFNAMIRQMLGRMRIQDLVLNYYCVSTDIQKRDQVVHTKGSLWKYVRASMSLAGYFPPISEDGSLLADGGYFNVVPADVMRNQMGAQTVIAVDVSGELEREYYDYGTYLSGWWLLWNSLNPFTETVKVPSMGDISDSLRWVVSDRHKRDIVQFTDLHLTPPVKKYGTLDFAKYDEIVENAYNYAKPIVDDWVKRNPRFVT